MQSGEKTAAAPGASECGPSGGDALHILERRVAADAKPGVALKLVSELCAALEDCGITYCHWKSNAALDRSASGDNDLDLLVMPADAERLYALLGRLSYKEAHSSSDDQVPGILDYYGLDSDSGRLVHVHVHTQLVLGHDATKNYHLPIEGSYLASAAQCGLFRVPAVEFEWVVFAIRMVLKHGTWDAMLTGHARLSASERQELAYLEARADSSRAHEILGRHLPSVGAALFDDCVRSLHEGRSFWACAGVAQQLQHSLRAFARRPQAVDVYLKLRHRLVWGVKGRVLHRRSGKRAPGGGLVVAIVGGDGAGKSTAVSKLSAWLGETFAVTKLHLGKPHWSGLTLAVRGMLKLGRSLGLYPFTRAPEPYPLEGTPIFPGYPTLVREVCTARDRFLTYQRAQRFADCGGVALCDRYPLPRVLAMDGPCVERMTAAGPQNAFVRFLARLEKQYYAAIMPPHLLVVLRVDPELAVQRKTDEDAASVRARCRAVWACDWGQANAHVVDATQPRERVLSELKAVIWAQM